MHYASGNRGRATAPGHGAVDGVDRDAGLHPFVDRVSDDPIRIDVFDRAQIQLALAGVVLCDISEPQTVRGLSGELAFYQVVMDRRSGTFAAAAPAAVRGEQTSL
ncbi:hypothetical protein TTY48_03810 [Tsukamurella sp. TY48]|nr:hypothetical protein TTY48_03810 [Tsukamurella sp. TY48]